MTDPFLIPPPFSVSFSGGRTSAYMLWRILRAYGGRLPEGAFVTFANTGMEREETLAFVAACQVAWDVSIRWLEYVPVMGGSRVAFREVAFATAARKGEPFEAMMDHERYVPNQRTRICTKNLKVLTMHAFLRAQGLDLREVTQVIGFRADEPDRVAKSKDDKDNDDHLLRFPLHAVGDTVDDVMGFWAQQPFDLALEPHEGNCTLCFLKGNAVRIRILQKRPDLAEWWIEQQRKRGHSFTKKGRKTYSDLLAIALKDRVTLPVVQPGDEPSLPCGCHD